MNAMTSSKILIIDGSGDRNEPTNVMTEVINSLKTEFQNVSITDESTAWRYLEAGADLVFIEYSVTDMKGILFFKKMSQDPRYSLIPTIFVSKTKAYDHRVNAFEIGAADFLSRPFEDERVIEMAHDQLQNRRRIFPDGTVQVGNMFFQPNSHSVIIDEKRIKLTDLEFKILQYLLITPKNVIGRDEICRHVWGENMINTGRLDTQLYNLKKKIAAFNGKIKSVNKIGMRVLVGETTFYQEQKKPVLQSLPQEAHL